MKVFLIIYSAAKIVGFSGPFPHGLEECTAYREAMRLAPETARCELREYTPKFTYNNGARRS